MISKSSWSWLTLPLVMVLVLAVAVAVAARACGGEVETATERWVGALLNGDDPESSDRDGAWREAGPDLIPRLLDLLTDPPAGAAAGWRRSVYVNLTDLAEDHAGALAGSVDELAQTLTTGERRAARRGAALVLESIGGVALPVRDALVIGLEDGDAFVRTRCMAALARLRYADRDATIASLVGMLWDPSSEVRAAALDALRFDFLSYGASTDRLVDRLLTLTRAGDASLRAAAVRFLGEIRPVLPTVRARLEELRTSADSSLRESARVSLLRIGVTSLAEQRAIAARTFAELLQSGNSGPRDGQKLLARLDPLDFVAVEPWLRRCRGIDDHLVLGDAARRLLEHDPGDEDGIFMVTRALEIEPFGRCAGISVHRAVEAGAPAVASMIDLLQRSRGGVKHRAIAVLGRIGTASPAAAEALGDVLRSGTSWERGQALDWLEYFGETAVACTEDLVSVVEAESIDERERAVALEIAVAGGSDAVRETVARLLDRPDLPPRLAAATLRAAVAVDGAGAHRELVRDAVFGDDPVMRDAACEILQTAPILARDIVPDMLIAAVDEKRETGVLVRLVHAADLSLAQVEPWISEELIDGDGGIDHESLDLLASFGDEARAWLGDLEQGYRSCEDALDRECFVEAILAIDPASGAPLLNEMLRAALESPDEWSYDLLELAAEHGSRDSVPLLVRCVVDGGEEVDVDGAVLALGELGLAPQLAVPCIVDAARAGRVESWASAAEALARFGEQAAFASAALIEAIETDQLDLASGATALAAIFAGSGERMPVLERALDLCERDEDLETAERIRQALDRIADG